MGVWYQPKDPGREAARLGADGHIILCFGKHRGRALHTVPEAYLKWLASEAAEDFAPADLRRRAAALLEGKQGEAVAQQGGPPDLRRRDVMMAWAETADPAEVAELCAYLRLLADEIETTGGAER